MTRVRALGIAWSAIALFSMVITFIFRTGADGYVVTLILGLAATALGARLVLRPDHAAATSVMTGVAWLAVYGILAILQEGGARITDIFLAMAGTALGYASWTMQRKRVASAEPAAPGTGWLRLAAILYIFLGLAFGASVPFVLAFHVDNGYLPTMFFFRALSGPLEESGRTAFLAAGLTLVAASAVSAVAGLLLWRGQRRGAQLGLLVDPIVFVLGLGFALPLLLIGVPVRAGSVLAGLRRVRRADLSTAQRP